MWQVDAQWAWVPLPGAMLGDEEDATLRLAPRWAELEPEAVRATHLVTLSDRVPLTTCRDQHHETVSC